MMDLKGLWDALLAVDPGIRRAATFDAGETVIMSERKSPNHVGDGRVKTYRLDLTLARAVDRLPPGLDDDPVIEALCEALARLSVDFDVQLEPNEQMGKLVYYIRIQADVLARPLRRE